MREIDGLSYINCGDWVDSCTAVVEHFDGRLELVAWGWQPVARPAVPPAVTPVPAAPLPEPAAARRMLSEGAEA
jgi:hypothetical protein